MIKIEKKHGFLVFLIGLFVFSSFIFWDVPTRTVDPEEYIDIETPEGNETMLFDYNIVGNIFGGKKPFSTYLIIQTNLDYLIFISAVDQTKLYCTKDKGATLTTDGDFDNVNYYIARTQKIQAMYYDIINEYIYFMDCDNNGVSTTIDCWYLDLSNLTIHELGVHTNTGDDLYALDIFYSEGNMHGLYCRTPTNLYVVDLDTAPLADVGPTLITNNIKYCKVIVISNTAYIAQETSAVNGYLRFVRWTRGAGSVTSGCGYINARIPTNVQFLGTNYDDFDKIRINIYDNVDGNHYLWEYSILGDSWTIFSEYNISIMLDRNVDIEKGFHISEAKIYTFSKNLSHGQLYNIAQPIIGTGYTIIAITDSYLITDNGTTPQLWEFVDISDEIAYQKVFYKASEMTRAEVFTERIFGSGQTIELYEDVSDPTTNTLAFRGTIKEKKYKGGLRKYYCTSFDKEIINNRVSEDYTGLGYTAKDIMEDIIDKYSKNWSYYTTTPDSIDPDGDFVVVREPIYKNKKMYECFDDLMDSEDGAWASDPDGLILAWQIVSIPRHQLTSQEDLYQATYNFKNDTLLAIPDGWIDSGIVATGHAYIVSDYQGHNKVLELFDGTGQAVIAQVFTAGAQITGTIEWYMGLPDVTAEHKLHFCDGYPGYVTAVGIRNSASKLQYWNGGWLDVGVATVNDVWYLCKLEFDCTADTFNFYVDGVLYQNGVALNGNRAGIDAIDILSMTAASFSYFDAFGYSWDNKYVGELDLPYLVGDNLIEEHIHINETKSLTTSHALIVIDTPEITEIMEQINKVVVYGGIVAGARLKNVSPFGEDLPGQLLNGIIDFIDYFESMFDQTAINNLADAILNRTGFADNPIYIEVFLVGLGYRRLIQSFRFKYAPYSEIENYATFYPQELELDLDGDTIGKYILSSGLVQKSREGKINATKTSTSDEGQIDTLALHPADTADPHNTNSVIHMSHFNGYAGFVESQYFGATLSVVFSDTSALVYATFYVKRSGTFTIRIIHMGTGDNNGKTASGKMYAGVVADGGTDSWSDISAGNADLPLGNALIMKYYDHATTIAVADNTKVGVAWEKDDNAEAAAGNMHIYAIVLVRN